MKTESVKLKDFYINNNLPFTLIAGPCVIEGKNHAIEHAEEIHKIAQKLSLNFVFKSSFDKANRTSHVSSRGVGMKKGLEILLNIKDKFNLPITTDVHEAKQCDEVSKVADIIQIPAFLCRQTDLLIAAGKTKKIVNIKKGQFLAPWDMEYIVQKIKNTGNQKLLLTERGTSFGYNNLVVDMRSIDEMKKTSCPIIFDATHSVQKPGGLGKSSGGDRKQVPVLASAAVAVGVAGIFMEVHKDPDNAPSDGKNMIKLKDLEKVLGKLISIDRVIK
tara:strand:- start:92 stop:913 length:822 start_codon:yes stop_codon:yes gene_type:complete